MGKSAAKAAHHSGTLKKTPEDWLDTYSRNINNNQTIGIPIGPDTSRLLAEVILGRIDEELASGFKRLDGFRFIDDYEFATSTQSEAEQISSQLQQLLCQFELALNPSKTEIIALPIELEPYWTSRIRVFLFREAGITGQANDLTAYFDMVFDLFKKYPEEGLLKYAIARLNGIDVHRDNWSLYEHILNQCLRVEPACLPQICDQVTHYKTLRFKLNRPLWSDTLNSIVCEQLPLGHASEAAWAMWLMKLINIRLKAKAAKIVGLCEDSIAGLMGLGLAAVGLSNMDHFSALNRFSPASGLFEDQWLLCYQGNLMGWLGAAGGNLRQDPCFHHLKTLSVSFFDIGIAPPPPLRSARATTYSSGGGGGY